MEEQASSMQIMMQMLKELKDNTHEGSQGGSHDGAVVDTEDIIRLDLKV